MHFKTVFFNVLNAHGQWTTVVAIYPQSTTTSAKSGAAMAVPTQQRTHRR